MALTQAQSERLTRAVAAAEAKTSVELVLTVLPRAQGYLSGPTTLGAVAAFVALGLTLFLEEPEVEPALVVPLVGLSGVAAFALAAVAPVAWFSRAKDRQAAVEAAAHAAFSKQGVYRTSGRTGLLVLLSLAERQACLVPDVGVLAAVPAEVRDEWLARLSAVAARFDVEALAAEVEQLGERASIYLPRSVDDVDELPNAPEAA